MTKDLFEFLNQFVPVSAKDFEELMTQVEECNYDKRVKLTEIGQVEEYMYFIIKGLARKYFYKEKEEIITHIVNEGGMIGSGASFLSGLPSRYVVETLEPTMALRISKERLENLYSSSKKWEKIGRILTAHFFLIQEFRLLDNIRYSNSERFIKFMNENPDLVMRVPQKFLASYLNIKPETFSRLKHLMLTKV